jgi:hypothetical protein
VNGGLGEAGGVRGAGCNGTHEHTHDSNKIESHRGFFWSGALRHAHTTHNLDRIIDVNNSTSRSLQASSNHA